MKLTSTQRSLVGNGLGLLIALVALALIALVELPELHAQRSKIDSIRATAQLDVQRQNNLEAVAKQLTDLHDQQTSLDTQIWKFVDEEKFFALWSDLAHQTGTTISDPVVADATPSSAPVQRSVSLSVSGPVNGILAAITAIQKMTPLVAINTITLHPGLVTNRASADIQASTLWN